LIKQAWGLFVATGECFHAAGAAVGDSMVLGTIILTSFENKMQPSLDLVPASNKSQKRLGGFSGGVSTQRPVDQPADQTISPPIRRSGLRRVFRAARQQQRKEVLINRSKTPIRPQRFRPHNELCRAILQILHHNSKRPAAAVL
jgi:hypothetical protein